MSSDGWKEAAFIVSLCSAVVSVPSALIARRALANSTASLNLAQAKHQWEEDDRSKRLAAEASAADERAWCERVRLRLEASPDDGIAVSDDKLDWALRGDRKYFQVVRKGNLTFIYPVTSGGSRRTSRRDRARARSRPGCERSSCERQA